MEKFEIYFEPEERKITFYKLDVTGLEAFISKYSSGENKELSNRFKSQILNLREGGILEIRKLGSNIEACIYGSLDDLRFCRKVFTTVRQDNSERLISISLNPSYTEFYMKKYSGIVDERFVEDTRKVVKLNNGQFLVLFRDGSSDLYNSISDIQYLVPFESEDYDVDVVERDTKIYVDKEKSFIVKIIDNRRLFSTYGLKDISKNKTLKIDDKDLVVVNEFFSVLYNPNEAYGKVVTSALFSNTVGAEVVEETLIPNENIEELVVLSIQNLVEILNCQGYKLDFTLQSLEYLDQTVNRFLFTKEFAKLIVFPISIYMGEVLRKHGKYNWGEFSLLQPITNLMLTKKKSNVYFVNFIKKEFDNQIYTGDFSCSAIVQGVLLSAGNI